MEQPIHRDASSAWEYLCLHGGLELEGRDEGLEDEIRRQLNPAASSLEDALSQATLDHFAKAFFKAIHPFLAMFSDVLAFFEQAGAKEGRAQWRLQIDDLDATLEHFREWITTWKGVASVRLQVPAIDQTTVWRLWETLSSNPVIRDTCQNFRSDSTFPSDVRSWLTAYEHGEYLALPDSLGPAHCAAELRDTASIVQAALMKIEEVGMTRGQLLDAYRARNYRHDRTDALDFWTIAQNETDFWLRTFIIALSTAATQLDKDDLVLIGNGLSSTLSKWPRKPIDVHVAVADLESVLSLPIWEKRHDLYSVWIATEIIRALDHHDVELHHHRGKITFSFKETVIATLHSSPGPFKLISERRSPLESPQGKGRVAGVQPDHGLWTVKAGIPSCRMSIEVKHYKKSSNRSFRDVFEDYARAFPEGEVYLVNHGPVSDIIKDLSSDVQGRCHVLQKLTSLDASGRQILANAVRQCVGEPIIRWPDVTHAPEQTAALVFDVSGSMKTILESAEMNVFVRQLISNLKPMRLVAVDVRIVGSWPATEDGYSSLLQSGGGSTALKSPINELQNQYESVVIVTDDDGILTIKDLPVDIHPLQVSAPASIQIRVCQIS